MQSKARTKGRNQRHVSGLSGLTKEAPPTTTTTNTTTARSTTPSPLHLPLPMKTATFWFVFFLTPHETCMSYGLLFWQNFPWVPPFITQGDCWAHAPVHLCECQVPQRYVNSTSITGARLYDDTARDRYAQRLTLIGTSHSRCYLSCCCHEGMKSYFPLPLFEWVSVLVSSCWRANCETGVGGLPVVVI